MRLPAISQFKSQIQSLSKQQELINTLQLQGASRKKIQHGSEDPLLANRIQAMGDYLKNLESFNNNGEMAQSRSNLVDTTLQSALGLVNRAQELLKQAQNGTISDTDRAILGEEMKGLVDKLYTLTNTRDSNGDYIFSGINAKTAAYTKTGNQFSFQGSHEPIMLSIGPGNHILFGDSGHRVFGDIKTGNGFFTVTANRAVNTGTGVANTGTVMHQASLVEDHYTLRFVTNQQGELAVEVWGQNSGQVVPAPPAASPADAPAWVPNADISFNGISMQVSGNPNPGDTFDIVPATTHNALDTLNELAGLLGTRADSPEEKAQLQQSLSNFGASLGQINNHLRARLSENGARAQNIDSQVNSNLGLLTDGQIDLQKLEEVDLTQVISQMTQLMTTLQITQQSYLKLQEVFYSFLNPR